MLLTLLSVVLSLPTLFLPTCPYSCIHILISLLLTITIYHPPLCTPLVQANPPTWFFLQHIVFFLSSQHTYSPSCQIPMSTSKPSLPSLQAQLPLSSLCVQCPPSPSTIPAPRGEGIVSHSSHSPRPQWVWTGCGWSGRLPLGRPRRRIRCLARRPGTAGALGAPTGGGR